MKVFIIGGTGLVGSYVLPRLVDKDNEVYALTRNKSKIEKIEKLGAHGIFGDIRCPDTFKKVLPEKLDIIILLAMPGVKPGRRISKKRKEKLRRETNDFFRNSMDLAIQFNAPVILPGGTSFRTENEQIADETWPVLRTGITDIGRDTDKMVDDAIRIQKPDVIQLLFGKIYGNGGLFRFMYNMMEKGQGRVLGKGDNFIPNIHAYDAASAIMKAIERLPVGERFIIADDTAVTQKDFTNYMADLMDKRRPKHIPAFIIRMVLGKDFYEIARLNCKVSNAKAKRLLDWHPQYPSYKEGLEQILEEMKEKENYFS